MRFGSLLVVGGAVLASTGAMAQTRTLADALAAAYANNPTLQTARAQLRATDEGVPQALAGWRPTVIVSASTGYAEGTARSNSDTGATKFAVNRDIATGQATLTQPLFRGGATRAGTEAAENKVYSQRAQLLSTEQQVFGNVVTAYVSVIQAQQILQLNINNEQVLAKQLQATQDRFRVGEITRTDVAQAEAALAGARATRQTSEGNLQTARGSYRQYVGELPDRLVEPQPVAVPVRNQGEAVQLAVHNNPAVVSALFADAAARDNVDLQFAALMPQISLQANGARTDNQLAPRTRDIAAEALLNVSIPIYQGGAEYSRVRQARQQEQQARQQVADIQRQVAQQATTAWETLVAARATIESTKAQIRANEIALEGVEREAIVGSRTTLDVLNAEQALLNSRVTLVQNLANLITASYVLASSVGRLTARDLALRVPLYDDTAYYNQVRNRLFGTGDYSQTEPAR